MQQQSTRGPAAGPALIGIAALTAFVAVLRATQPLLDGIDPFWHLDLGRRILSSGLPHGDPYSFLSEGRVWILNQWGTEAIIGFVDRIGGLWLLGVLTAALVAAVYGLAGWVAWKRAPALSTVVLLGLAVMSHTNNWSLRGNLFTFVLLSVLVREILRAHGPRLVVVGPLMVLWANLHAGFLTGVVLLAAHGVGSAAIARHERRMAVLGRHGLLVAAGLLAGMVTPWGPRFLWSTLELAGRANNAGITEWGPTAITTPVVLPYTLLMATVLAALAVSGRREDLPEILMTVATVLLGVSAIRNVAPAAIVLTILGAPHVHRAFRMIVANVSDTPPARGPSMLDRTVAGVLVTAGLLSAVAIVPRADDVASHSDDIPLAIIHDLAALDRPARVFTLSDWAAPIAMLTGDDVRTAVDGRLELFSDDEIDQARTAIEGGASWRATLRAWCVTDALLPSTSDLSGLLSEEPGWSLASEADVLGTDERARWYQHTSPAGDAC